MDNKRSHKSIISTGTTSIVLIFVMLSLLTFAVLSLVSAQANLRLSRKSAERTTAYYQAENAANDVLAGLLRAQQDGPQALTDYAAQQQVTLTGSSASYQVPLGEDQVLAVELTLSDGGYEIDRWQAVSSYDWNADKPLGLMGTGPLILP